MRAWAKKLYDAKDAGYLQTRNSHKDYVSYLFQNREALFTVSSNAGLSYNYAWDDPFAIGVAKIPHAEGQEYSSINQGPSVCILDHQDEDRTLASFLFWKHLTNRENSATWAVNTGYMGIRNSAYSSDIYQATVSTEEGEQSYAAAVSKNLLKAADVRSSTFNTKVFRGSGNARTDVSLLLKAIFKSDGQEDTITGLFEEYESDARNYLPKSDS